MSDSGQIFSSTKNLSIGTSGQDVRDLQTALNLRPPSSLPILNPDGMFGAKTDARVKEFQGNKGLVADGIVGPKTRAALAGLDFPTTDHGSNCCNPENFSSGQSREVSEFLRNNRSSAGNKSGFSAGTGSGSFASAGASLLQPLTIAQIGQAKVVYGASLDFSSIFISRQTGVGGRPFTFAFDDNGSTVQIMNCGSFTPRPRTLIHELAHVWQSQHHADKYRFMVNAVDSQAGAVVASTAAAIDDPIVILNKNFPTFYPFDAYAYDPGLPFANMAAEQMAKAIENGETAVVAHVKGVTKNMVDPACVAALSRPGFADRRRAGVK